MARAAAPEAPPAASAEPAGKGRAGASGIGSGIKLENVRVHGHRLTCARLLSACCPLACGGNQAHALPTIPALPTPLAPARPAAPLPEQVAITFKNQQVLKDISWDVKKGERVGLVGVNGAGKTTQLQVGWWMY